MIIKIFFNVLYILILIAPALLFSLRIILIEVAALVSVSNYGKELFWVKSLIGKITGSEITEVSRDRGREIDGAKYEMIRLMMEILMDGTEETDDDTLGADRALEKTSLSYKIAFVFADQDLSVFHSNLIPMELILYEL